MANKQAQADMAEERKSVAQHFVDGAQSVTKFDGDDKTYSSTRWSQDVEDNAEIFGWTPQQTLIIARKSLTGTAELWLKSEKVFKTYEELKAALQKEFPDAINSKEMHELMSNRKKRNGETYYQYMLVMRELGRRAKFPDYVAIQYIVDGISDFESNKAILYGVTTYAALKDKLAIYEKIKANSAKLRKSETASRPKRQFIKGGNSPRRCYNCGESDHVATLCTKGTKCFRCNKYGHIGRFCPESGDHGRTASSQGAMSAEQPKIYHSNYNRRLPTATLPTQQLVRAGSPTFEAHGDTVTTLTASADNCVSSVKRYVNSGVVQNINNSVKNVEVYGFSKKGLVDTGSEVNLMTLDVYYCLINVEKHVDSLVLSGLGNSLVKSEGKIFVNITIDGQCFNNVVFHLVCKEVMSFDLILGQEFLSDVVLLMNKNVVTLIPNDLNEWSSKMCNFASCMKVSVISLDHVRDESMKREILRCVEHYKPLKTKEAPIELNIVLKDDIPVAQRPRRLSITEQLIVEKQIDEWLQNGIIRVSYSEYSSPLVLVKKKDGSVRVCIDYRLLNRKIVKDEFPLPVIDDLIDKLCDARVFSVLDLKNGFFHLKVSEKSIPYTSFVTHNGQYEFMRAPFGLTTCPKTFMRFVTIIFRELIAKGILIIFIDDILIPARNEVEGLNRLKQVLEVASSYGLEINWKKASLIQREIQYLGHLIKDGEVRPSHEKTEAVIKYPEPKNSKQLHSFIGLTSYFRKYIENYAIIAKPLTDLLKKNVDFTMDEQQKTAFEKLKRKLADEPVLKIYDSRLVTELHTDASCEAYAAILMQHHPNTGLHPVHFMSRKTNEAQGKYSSYELEALAIIEGVKKFRHYLYGIHFKIVTDCKAFELTLKKRDLTPRVARWVLFLNDYDFEIEHRPGDRMKHVDALSRNPYVALLTTSVHDEIRLAQNRDDGLRAIKEILNEKSYDDYWLQNDILYKGVHKQLVVPKSLEKDILKKTHDIGHFSKKKMREIINRDYYINNVDKKIEDFIVGCVPCILATRKEGKQEGFLNPIEKSNLPLDTLHLDHIGPLCDTKKQYNHILTMVDAFTKFVWLFPTKTTSSNETLDKLRIHQHTFGNPRRIITDRGTAFTGKEFTDYCKDENIEHVTITTGVPRGNGQVERIHRIIIPTLTKLCIENQGLWYRHISKLQRALNCTFQRSINTTPFELLIGVKMKTKEDQEILNILQQENIEQFNQNRDDSRNQAKEQILKIQAENINTYNRKRKKSHKYNVGDLVATKRTQFGPGLKLKPKFLGPYKVVKIKRNDRYDLEKVDSSSEGPNKTSSSADHMKEWPSSVDLSLSE